MIVGSYFKVPCDEFKNYEDYNNWCRDISDTIHRDDLHMILPAVSYWNIDVVFIGFRCNMIELSGMPKLISRWQTIKVPLESVGGLLIRDE